MAARKVVGYLRDSIRNYGIAATLHELQCRAINSVVQFQILKGMTVRTQDVRDPSWFEAPGFDRRFVSEGDLWKYAQNPAHQMTPEFLRDALRRGDRCYALIDRGKLAAYGWYTDRCAPLDEHFELHFGSGWTYMYKGYTMPEYRGKRLHALAMCGGLQALTAEGRNGLISCVASNNFASLRSVKRMGYQIFGDLMLLRAGGRCFTLATRGCRPYGFRAEALTLTPHPATRARFGKQ